MKPAYKVGQRIKVIPHFKKLHEEIPCDTYKTGDTGIVEEIGENSNHHDYDHHVYGIRFDHDNNIHYALESMIIPEDYEHMTDNFTTNPNVKRVIGKSNTTLLCVCEVDGSDYAFEQPFLNY